MDHLIISIGQAGNQINYELSNLFLQDLNNKNHYNSNFLTMQGDLVKNILIDTEPKVIKSKFLSDPKISKFYAEDINIITNSSGRGNNWSLGYSLDYKEIRSINNEYKNFNISLDSVEKINKFIERCDFLKGFMFLHSLNGGTGSGVSSRIIEMLKDQYPKFNFVDCPVIGMNIENTTLSQYNKFFTFSHVYEYVDYFFLLNNEKFKKISANKKFDYKSMNTTMAKLLYSYLTSEQNNRNSFSFSYSFQNLKFIDLIQYSMNYMMEIDINTESLNKLIYHNEIVSSHGTESTNSPFKRNMILSSDFNFSTNCQNFKCEPYFNKLQKIFLPKFSSYGYTTDKSLKNNFLELNCFIKNYEHRNIMERLASNIEEKIRTK